jgi:hypothetical protein
MDAKLRQVANGFDFKVCSFDKYDINGYRFRTYGKELSMADRNSTNCCVSAIGEGDTGYYGRVEAIYELLFYGENPPNVVVFKCYWFQPKETRRTHEHIGLVEIKRSTHLDVPDVYIMAQQATQVFYLPWACQTDPNLNGWDFVYEVPPHVRPPPPNEEDYEPHINPDTYEGEFFRETHLSKKRFKKRSTSPQSIEVDSDRESDFTPEPEQEETEQEEVTAADDLSMLDRLRKGGLPHVDAFIDVDDEHVINDSDDDDALIDPEAYIDDED